MLPRTDRQRTNMLASQFWNCVTRPPFATSPHPDYIDRPPGLGTSPPQTEMAKILEPLACLQNALSFWICYTPHQPEKNFGVFIWVPPLEGGVYYGSPFTSPSVYMDVHWCVCVGVVCIVPIGHIPHSRVQRAKGLPAKQKHSTAISIG